MKKGILTIVLVFAAFILQAQRNIDRTNFRAGVNGGIVLGDFAEDYSFSLGLDLYQHWGVSKALDIGVTAGFSNAFGEKQTLAAEGVNETEFDNVQYLPLGASFRIYPGKNVGFKFGGDIGYAVGISEGEESALYYRPSLGIDLRQGTSEINISYFVINDDASFSSVLLGYIFLF